VPHSSLRHENPVLLLSPQEFFSIHIICLSTLPILKRAWVVWNHLVCRIDYVCSGCSFWHYLHVFIDSHRIGTQRADLLAGGEEHSKGRRVEDRGSPSADIILKMPGQSTLLPNLTPARGRFWCPHRPCGRIPSVVHGRMGHCPTCNIRVCPSGISLCHFYILLPLAVP